MDYATIFGIVKHADLHIFGFGVFSLFDKIHVTTLYPNAKAVKLAQALTQLSAKAFHANVIMITLLS